MKLSKKLSPIQEESPEILQKFNSNNPPSVKNFPSKEPRVILPKAINSPTKSLDHLPIQYRYPTRYKVARVAPTIQLEEEQMNSTKPVTDSLSFDMINLPN